MFFSPCRHCYGCSAVLTVYTTSEYPYPSSIWIIDRQVDIKKSGGGPFCGRMYDSFSQNGMYLSVCPSLYQSIYPSIYLPLCLFPSIYPSIYLSISIYDLSIYQSDKLSTYLPVRRINILSSWGLWSSGLAQGSSEVV